MNNFSNSSTWFIQISIRWPVHLKIYPLKEFEPMTSRKSYNLLKRLCYDYLQCLARKLNNFNVNNFSNSSTWFIQISIRWPVHLKIYPLKEFEPMTSRKSYNLLKRLCYDYLQLSIKCPRSLVDFTTVTKSQI